MSSTSQKTGTAKATRNTPEELLQKSMLPLLRVINHAFLTRLHRWEMPEHAIMVLLRLRVHPEDGEPAILAEITCLPRQTMTMALDSLEGLRLARRIPHPHDRRRKRIVLTPAGEKLGSRVLNDLLDFESKALAAVPNVGIPQVKEFLSAFA